MKYLKRILMVLAIIIALGVVIGFITLRYISRRALPDYNESVQLLRIHEKVEVYRDRYAVPHVYAKNEEDLYRAVGYVMAQDRLWEMDLLRRITQGRLSEIFGESQLKFDQLMRALQMTEKSKSMLSQTDPSIVKLAEAFTDGVNQYIDMNMNRLPPEFTLLGYKPGKWEVVHSVNLEGYMAWGLSMAWNSEVLLNQLAEKLEPAKFEMLIPDLSKHGSAVFPDFTRSSRRPGEFDLQQTILADAEEAINPFQGVFDGSNNWAVSGQKSTTGKPIMGNDMHLGLFVPGIWYPMHQVVEGDSRLNVTGVVLPGQPFIVAGHNENIAWGMTNVMVDDMDFYRETINPSYPDQYRFNGEWKNMRVVEETFKIKGGKSIKRKYRYTHRGPIISELKEIRDKALSMHWIGSDYSNELRSVYLLNRASNWEQFRDAVKSFIAISQNIVYADTAGNIGLQTCAGVPIRKGNGRTIFPGDTAEYDWTGIVPFEELPYSYNPPEGHVSSANNKTVDSDYPYYISYWYAVPNRINRIRQMLASKEKLSVEDFKQMQADLKSLHALTFLGDIVSTLEKRGNWGTLDKKVLELLSRWDGVMNKESEAAAFFENMYLIMIKQLAADELGEPFFDKLLGNKILSQNLMINVWNKRDPGWIDNIRTQQKETFEDWISASFSETVRSMEAEWGSDPSGWKWKKMHSLELRHPVGQVKILDLLFGFNRRVEVGGSFDTVCPYSYSFRSPFTSDYGASHRHIYSTADWDDSFSVIPTGVSGIPASPFYCDQTPLYTANKYHRDLFGKSVVLKYKSFKMNILPR